MNELAPATYESSVTGLELNLRNTVFVLSHDKNLESGVKIQSSHPKLFRIRRSKNNVLIFDRLPGMLGRALFPAQSEVQVQLEITLSEYFCGGLKLKTFENTQSYIDCWIGGTLNLDVRRAGRATFGVLDDVATNLLIKDRSIVKVEQWKHPFDTRTNLSGCSILDVNRFQSPRFRFDIDVQAGCLAKFKRVSNATPCQMNITGGGTLEVSTVANGAPIIVTCSNGEFSLLDQHEAIQFDTVESERYVDRSTGEVSVPPLLAKSRLCLHCKDNGNFIKLADERSWKNRPLSMRRVSTQSLPISDRNETGFWSLRPW